jgi:hypothetical protein
MGLLESYEYYIEDRDWEEFKDVCTHFLAHSRGVVEVHEETPEGSGEPAQSEPTESIQQCLIRLADETNDQGFVCLPISLGMLAAHELYLIDKDWEEFKDTYIRFLAHFRAKEDREETPEGS